MQAGWQTAWAWLVLVVLAVDEIWSLVGKQLEQDFSVMIVRTDERDYIMEEQKRHNYCISRNATPNMPTSGSIDNQVAIFDTL